MNLAPIVAYRTTRRVMPSGLSEGSTDVTALARPTFAAAWRDFEVRRLVRLGAGSGSAAALVAFGLVLLGGGFGRPVASTFAVAAMVVAFPALAGQFWCWCFNCPWCRKNFLGPNPLALNTRYCARCGLRTGAMEDGRRARAWVPRRGKRPRAFAVE
jgi:hypothetical protein